MRYLLMYGVIFFLIPVLLIYLRLRFINWLKKNNRRYEEDTTTQVEDYIESIYETERKPLYLQARGLFNVKMKSGMIHRKEFEFLDNLIKNSLGDYIQDYKYYKFKNKAHRLYVLMKDIHIQPNDWKIIINYLQRIG